MTQSDFSYQRIPTGLRYLTVSHDLPTLRFSDVFGGLSRYEIVGKASVTTTLGFVGESRLAISGERFPVPLFLSYTALWGLND